jgi:hypothetical protein
MASEFYRSASLSTPPTGGKKPKVYAKGRGCDIKECRQQLTRFNPRPSCYLHVRKTRRRVRGAPRGDTAG